jgi:hypothetical protein
VIDSKTMASGAVSGGGSGAAGGGVAKAVGPPVSQISAPVTAANAHRLIVPGKQNVDRIVVERQPMDTGRIAKLKLAPHRPASEAADKCRGEGMPCGASAEGFG